MKRIGLAGVALVVVFFAMAGSAWAEATTTICVPEHASSQVLSTNAKGECPAKIISKVSVKYRAETLPGTAELEKLDKILPHVNYVESGVGGKATIQFSGLNVQVVNGEGKTASVNGEGNLVIGYDEGKREQTGSHNLVLGEEQTFTSYGGILGGRLNTVSAPFASVTGGSGNTASASASSVSGGGVNTASAFEASVSGGSANTASFREASVSGGHSNTASGEDASVSGGTLNQAFTTFASVSGGQSNTASGSAPWVGGGFKNAIAANYASIFGGKELVTTTEYGAIP
ncbi:MAG: hypothetical protein M3Z95_03095 [Actinomycetota bacterium]|nr:hypothetical protein [Actinomycetota bacterium]